MSDKPTAITESLKDTAPTAISTSTNVGNDIAVAKAILEHLVEDKSTGVNTVGAGLLMMMKAKELGIGFGNAIPHMQIINGKAGIDVHIIKALLSNPNSGVTWTHTKDNVPLYNYTDGHNIFIYQTLPENYIILPKLSGNPDVDKYRSEGKYPVVILPAKDGKIVPIDYISEYKFERIKKDIKGDWITVTTVSKFTWSEAITAKLPLDKAGQINPDSAWYKYRNLMLNHRAFTFGARDIASDILLGNYSVDELLDMNDYVYDIDNDGIVDNIKPID